MQPTPPAYRPWAIRMPWTAFDATRERDISGSNGVYELAAANGAVLYIGSAGARELFGLRGRIARHFSPAETNPAIKGSAASYRYEVTSAYLSRWMELLGRYSEEHGSLPPGNQASGETLPRLPRFGRPATPPHGLS